ncbi:MAG: hypothetical protein ISS36_01910 [Candidatus Aenigmarchaeota archaeon]|nr:hypothetical protein [Candidatus Aenigmarchaeota archaeon]
MTRVYVGRGVIGRLGLNERKSLISHGIEPCQEYSIVVEDGASYPEICSQTPKGGTRINLEWFNYPFLYADEGIEFDNRRVHLVLIPTEGVINRHREV